MRHSLLAACFAVGCAAPLPTVNVAGYPVVKDYWDGINASVRAKAAFLMRCPVEQLQLTPLDIYDDGDGCFRIRQVGVDGCGQRMIFVTSERGWTATATQTTATQAIATQAPPSLAAGASQ